MEQIRKGKLVNYCLFCRKVVVFNGKSCLVLFTSYLLVDKAIVRK